MGGGMMAVRRMLVAGRYRLLEPVGAGGMGRVWLARDEMLARDVAVKEFVPPEWMTDEEKARLRDRTLREAQSAGRLNHPHVVRVFDVVHAEGLPWIVMEYVPSRSLHQVINEDGPFSPSAAARIGLDVLDALTAAHRAGVLHRDVKPHNVLIGTDGRVVLTDFGLATFVDDGSITGPGLVVGSPQYVSPERARDGASTVESDLWSFGATLYAAVEGRSPYARDSAMATLMALATEPPDPPTKAGPLASVLTGLLRHEPGERLTAIEADRRLRAVATVRGAPGVPAPRQPQESQAGARVGAETAASENGQERAVIPTLRRGDQPAVPAQRTSSGPAPAASMPGESPEETPAVRRRRPIAVVAASAALVLLGGGGVTGYLMSRDDRPTASVAPPGGAAAGLAESSVPVAPSSSAAAVSGFSAAVCAGPIPAGAPTAPQPGAARDVDGDALPDGWSFYATDGFHLPVPDGWQVFRTGKTYCFRDTSDDRVLVLDTGRKITADPVQACRKEAARLQAGGALPDYHQISIQPKPLLEKAADWEYQYADPQGTRLHAKTRWFVEGGRGFAISWATREIDWVGDRSKIDMVLSAFYPDRSK
jgi:eukaryotic-like serine/threonine-protein kinase